MLKPVDGRREIQRTRSDDYGSILAAANAQHGGANVYNPIGTNPVYGDQPVKPNALTNANFSNISTFDNRAPESMFTSGNYGSDYTSSTEIPQEHPFNKGFKSDEGRLALAINGQSYFGNRNKPLERGPQLFGGHQVG